ncbi:uncharacterized protein BDR25DRAFT_361999 [Lindgomyces ingoldianus]|uniref:Uncharacterized protein n=1 Tax=Lindgomyces ingoldianus TaxID=673940 RepID=A0ACB6QB16_9PLEO|nr:uncharacterized protein BDR25DRAFT_361999 [Lindgomyces ingoldianus]KAF2464070.1 hypothetical protein BDR25DRAFT_361999 [Lindgomyces ingoldianus]
MGRSQFLLPPVFLLMELVNHVGVSHTRVSDLERAASVRIYPGTFIRRSRNDSKNGFSVPHFLVKTRSRDERHSSAAMGIKITLGAPISLRKRDRRSSITEYERFQADTQELWKQRREFGAYLLYRVQYGPLGLSKGCTGDPWNIGTSVTCFGVWRDVPTLSHLLPYLVSLLGKRTKHIVIIGSSPKDA